MDSPPAAAGARAVEADTAARERYLRRHADFGNLRRRSSREREAGHLEGRRAAPTPLLPVLDTLERARLGDTLLRPAQVVVVAPREPADPWR